MIEGADTPPVDAYPISFINMHCRWRWTVVPISPFHCDFLLIQFISSMISHFVPISLCSCVMFTEPVYYRLCTLLFMGFGKTGKVRSVNWVNAAYAGKYLLCFEVLAAYL